MGGVGKLRRSDAFAEWFRAHGVARIVPIDGVRSRDAVALYVSKYVMKDQGEMVFSADLGAYGRS